MNVINGFRPTNSSSFILQLKTSRSNIEICNNLHPTNFMNKLESFIITEAVVIIATLAEGFKIHIDLGTAFSFKNIPQVLDQRIIEEVYSGLHAIVLKDGLEARPNLRLERLDNSLVFLPNLVCFNNTSRIKQ